jgi:hypothetical protein
MPRGLSIRCPDCDAATTDLDGPVHAYLSAPAGCWRVYNDVLAKEYGDREYRKVHRLTVDTYAAQHATGDDPRQVQSVTIHLLALHLNLEKGQPEEKIRKTMDFVIKRNKETFCKLQRPSFVGIMNIVDVAGARDAAQHQLLVSAWAHQVWMAWVPVHELIRSLVSTNDPTTRSSRGAAG